MNGEKRFKQALRRFAAQPCTGEMPKPDDVWGVWVEYRLKRLEDGQQWLLRVILGALVVQVGLEVVKMVAG